MGPTARIGMVLALAAAAALPALADRTGRGGSPVSTTRGGATRGPGPSVQRDPATLRHTDRHRQFHRLRYYHEPWWWYRSPFQDRARLDEDRDRRRRENMEFDVRPKGTEIHVNGILYSRKGRTRFVLPVGKWTIEMRARGRVPQTLELDVQQGVHYTIERTLEKEPPAQPSPAR